MTEPIQNCSAGSASEPDYNVLANGTDPILRPLAITVMSEQTGDRRRMSEAESAIKEIIRLRDAAQPKKVPECVHPECDDPEWCAGEPRCRYASQPSPAATVETKSAPACCAPQNNAEQPPSSDAAGAGADTQCSAGNATDPDLVQRCRELLDWSKTGLLNGGKGGAVRAYADRLKEKIGEHYALNVAESNTKDEAMREIVRIADEPQEAVVPEGYILVPRCLTAENGAKGALSGEFHEDYGVQDERGDERWAKVAVNWTTIKEIHKAMVAHFDANPPLSRPQSRSAE